MEREIEGILTQQKAVLGNKCKANGTKRKGRSFVGSEGHTAECYFQGTHL